MELADQREELVEGGRRLAAHGLVTGSSGNLSVRSDDLVAVSPTGLAIGDMRPEDLAVLDLDGNWVEGPFKPTSEVPLHLAIYRATAARAVAHTHAVASAAVSCTCEELPAVHYNCLQLGGPVRVATYATYGSSELAANVVDALAGGRTAALMANHGSIAYGDTMGRACDRLELLEWLCTHFAAPGGIPMTQSHGVTAWPDIDAVEDACRRLVAGPAPRLSAERRAAIDDWFDKKCSTSRQRALEAETRIPGGVQHNLAFNRPFPLDIVRADGAHLWDVDGNQYIDFIQAGGPTVLGSNYGPVREKVIELLHDCGPVTGLFHDYEFKLASLIHDFMPGIELFRMLGSGTEGVMAALRASRVCTGHQQVIKVGGGYHGWSDQMVLGLRLPGTGTLDAAGIPEGALASTSEVWPDDIDALRARLEDNGANGGTAAVIVEPFGPESGVRPVRLDYNHRVKELCEEFGALLIFDEVVTGFRVGLGGAQGFFDLRPDLTVFGKCVASGYPAAGGVEGRADVMRTFAAGLSGSGPRAMVGGTLSANPLSCAAGYWSLVEMDRTQAPILAGRAADRLCAGLQASIDRHGLPFVTYNLASIVHLHTTGVLQLDLREPGPFAEIGPRKEGLEEFGAAFTAEGIITLAGSRLYTSLADTDDVIDDALARFDRAFEGVVV